MPGPFDQGWSAVVCAASGPSFSAEQAALVTAAQARGLVRVLAVGRTGPTRLPSADAVYYADRQGWLRYVNEIRAGCPRAQLWTQDAASALEFGLRRVELERRAGLSRNFRAVNAGGNSGYQAIGLAYLFGARRIVLVGYDMQRTGGAVHHFGNHGEHRGERGERLHNTPDAAYREWAKRFVELATDLKAAGVDAVNCTTETALRCFPRADLADTLRSFECCPA